MMIMMCRRMTNCLGHGWVSEQQDSNKAIDSSLNATFGRARSTKACDARGAMRSEDVWRRSDVALTRLCQSEVRVEKRG